jgi:hypothetical protein
MVVKPWWANPSESLWSTLSNHARPLDIHGLMSKHHTKEQFGSAKSTKIFSANQNARFT